MYYILKLELGVYVYMTLEHVSPIEPMIAGNGLQLGGSNGKSSLIQAIKGLGVPRGLLMNVSTLPYLSSAARPTNHTFIDNGTIDSLFEKMSVALHVPSTNDTIEDKDKALPKLKSTPKPKPLHNKNRKTKRALPPFKMSASLNKKRNTRKRNTRSRNT